MVFKLVERDERLDHSAFAGPTQRKVFSPGSDPVPPIDTPIAGCLTFLSSRSEDRDFGWF